MTGKDVIDNICEEVRKSLEHDCNLRMSDAYRNFSARASVQVQLEDLDRVDVTADTNIGVMDPQRPSQTVDLEMMGLAADEPANMERPIDSGEVPELPVRRQYISRLRSATK